MEIVISMDGGGVVESHFSEDLHSDDGVDEKEQDDEKSDVGKSLEEGRGIVSGEGPTWKDFMNVQRRVRIPSPRERSLTSLMTRNRRKKLMEMRFEPPGFSRP